MERDQINESYCIKRVDEPPPRVASSWKRGARITRKKVAPVSAAARVEPLLVSVAMRNLHYAANDDGDVFCLMTLNNHRRSHLVVAPIVGAFRKHDSLA